MLTSLSTLSASDLPAKKQGKESTGLVNPSSRYQVTDGWNLFLDVEFLWWVAKEDDLFFAQSGYTGGPTSSNPPDGTIDFNGHLQKVKPHWGPGARIGFGGNMEYDEWDIYLNWTWFETTARRTKHAKTDSELLVLWGHPDIAAATGATKAGGKWSMDLNVLDLELGRAFWVGRYFSIRPFIGARGAWIDQSFRVKYDLATSPEMFQHSKAHSDFEGGGIRAGADLRLALFGGWSFYGLASGSMLYGHFDCDYRCKAGGVSIGRTTDGFHQPATSAQLALGVRWDVYLHKDRYHFGLFAGWEQNMWFGMNKMNRYFGQLQNGLLQQMNSDLSLQGGTFGVRFDF
ncbi:MAG: hypothetical protein JSS61_01215 [Verrucomicrobia bacterium]|nr:hypothetical protein [Verrucomicrobiota bacterium]